MYQIILSQTLTEREEIERNIKTLFDTREGSLPANRDFGICWDCLDNLPEVAESLLYMDMIEKIERYEPRVTISSIVFEHSEGMMMPRVYLEGKEE